MLDPAGDRASPAGSVHVGVRTSAAKLAPTGWAADYRYARDDLYFVTAVLYDATNVASTRESYGLDWLLVAGQDVLCGTGATWKTALAGCYQCADGRQPSPNALAMTCVDCSVGRAGTGGVCEFCPQYTVANRDRTACNPCPPGEVVEDSGRCASTPPG